MLGFAAATLVIVLAGAAIGATSIGGVLVVPALTSLTDIAMPRAIAASSFGFLLTGLWAWRNAMWGSRRSPGASSTARGWHAQLELNAAAFAGAIVGVLLLQQVPAGWARLWIAALALASGVYAFVSARRTSTAARALPATPILIGLGVFVGVGSALSGTGGPVMLLPILLLIGIPVTAAIATALAVQLPIAVASSLTHLYAGTLDLPLGAMVGAALIVGAWLGHHLAARADPLTLRRAVAVVLIFTGSWFALA